MTYVVGENCIKCKYMDCVEVCPVECIPQDPQHPENKDQLLAKFFRLHPQALPK